MAVKISELPVAQAQDISNDDIVPIVDAPQGGTPRTKQATLQNLFTLAPVQSVNGQTGSVSLASSDLSDGNTLGKILSINGLNTPNISLGTSDLTDSSNVILRSLLGTYQAFKDEYENPTTQALQTEYEELARLLGTDQNNLRASLYQVQQTAQGAISSIYAGSTFVSLGQLAVYQTQASIYSQYHPRGEALSIFAKKTDVTNPPNLSLYATKAYVDQEILDISAGELTAQHIVAESASLSNYVKTDTINATGDIQGFTLTAQDKLEALRAEVGDGTNYLFGDNSTFIVRGNQKVHGTIVADSLEVLGSTKIKQTQVFEVSDDYVMLNKSDSMTTNTGGGGVQINRGCEIDPATMAWDNENGRFVFKTGSDLQKIDYSNYFESINDLPPASGRKGMFVMAGTQPLVSNGTEWTFIAGGSGSSGTGSGYVTQVSLANTLDQYVTQVSMGTITDFINALDS